MFCKPFLFAFLLIVCCKPLVWASEISLYVSRHDGAVTLHNSSASTLNITGYSLVSDSSSLLSNNWLSIANNYDTSGDQSVDATTEWSILAPTDNHILSEVVFTGTGGTILSGSEISLGNIWSTSGAQDLTLTVSKATSSLASVSVKYFLAGDYDFDLDVDTTDFQIWKTNFGSTTLLNADGNRNGIVDAADFTIWRDHLGLSASGSGASSSLTTTVVPEPSTLLLFLFGSTLLYRNLCRK